jgi:sialate O-acetylesterase
VPNKQHVYLRPQYAVFIEIGDLLLKPLRLLALLVLISQGARSYAQVRLPNVFSDHAVLQRNRPIHVWGSSTPGAHLLAHFHQQQIASIADARGRWSLYLQPESAGGPYVLTITGDGAEVTVSDLLVGDVWIASGQSNMEFPLQGFGPGTPLKDQANEIANATKPMLRLLRLAQKTNDFPLTDQQATWTLCTPDTARNFSAIAYFFGRDISHQENVPIGLVDTTWGGTPADSWISLNTLGSDPQLLPAFLSRAQFADEQGNLDATVASEKAEDEAARRAGKDLPKHPWHPNEASWAPAGIYNGMVAPLTPMTIKGFIWYQGETNAAPDRAPYYKSLFPALIGDWRSRFGQGDLPFLYVQISSYNSPSEDWGSVRDAQRRTLDVANTAMAVTLDVGNPKNVHPSDKQTVGARLALAARHLVYGKSILSTGPLFREATREVGADGSSNVRVWFDESKGLTSKGHPLTDFELAGPDHHFFAATAHIDGETVLVNSSEVQRPMYIRFGWAGVVDGNLYNVGDLPASTFSSELAP